jgi:hypothetical protein
MRNIRSLLVALQHVEEGYIQEYTHFLVKQRQKKKATVTYNSSPLTRIEHVD